MFNILAVEVMIVKHLVLYKYAEASVKDYCEKNEVYRRELLYKDFSCYTHN